MSPTLCKNRDGFHSPEEYRSQQAFINLSILFDLVEVSLSKSLESLESIVIFTSSASCRKRGTSL